MCVVLTVLISRACEILPLYIMLYLHYSHTITVTKSMLLDLFGHTLALKVWDTKDRVSPRARFDRPKALRLPMSRGPEEEPDDSEVQQLVLKQSNSFNEMQPKPSVVNQGN